MKYGERRFADRAGGNSTVYTKRSFFIAVAWAGLLGLNGCGSQQSAPQAKYYLVTTNTKVPYWQAAARGLGRAAAESNVQAEVVGPETYDPRQQHEDFQRVLQQDPAGILISVGDRRLMRPDIDSAIARGVPVITIDSDAEYSKRLFFVGTDNYQAGRLMGDTVATTLDGKGNVVVFTMPEQLNLVQRQHGLTDAFASHPNLKVTETVDIKGDARVAKDEAARILDKEASKVDAFVCLEAIACPEVAAVLAEKKAPGKLVVAMDADPRTLDGIKKSFISATIAQKPYTMAYVGLHMLVDLNRAKPGSLDRSWTSNSFSPFPKSIDTGVTLINSTNVDGYLNAGASPEQ